MRNIIVMMQTTLNNKIAIDQGVFWEPFPWGDQEMEVVNEHFRQCDTWVMGRRLYEAVMPWWEVVASGQIPDDVAAVSDIDRDFADILKDMTKVVVSHSMEPTDQREVIAGDIGARLLDMKSQPGRNVMLSAGPETLGPLLDAPGLVDELLLPVHPVVLPTGPGLFDKVTRQLALRPIEITRFEGGALLLRYSVTAHPGAG